VSRVFNCSPIAGLCGGCGCGASQAWSETVTATYQALDSDTNSPSWVSLGSVSYSASPVPNAAPICYTGTWTAGSCSVTCGGGSILAPTCSGGNGRCDPATQPASGQPCNTQACVPICTPSWGASTACSGACGGGWGAQTVHDYANCPSSSDYQQGCTNPTACPPPPSPPCWWYTVCNGTLDESGGCGGWELQCRSSATWALCGTCT